MTVCTYVFFLCQSAWTDAPLQSTIMGTVTYYLTAVHMEFSTGVLACTNSSPKEPLQPVDWYFCIGHPGGDTLPPPCRFPERRPASSYPIALYCDRYGVSTCSLPHLLLQPFPIWHHPTSPHPPPVLCGDISPRVTSS